MRYVALLRGVNVGGKNKIAMSELREAFEKQGFSDVVTYINSGNILFSSDLDATRIKALCEEMISKRFGLAVVVGIITAENLIEAIKNAPSWWGAGPDYKHNALFVIPPMTPEQVIEEVGRAKPEYEQVGSFGNVIFWSAPLATFSHSRWSKIVQNKKAYNAVTIRNANTAKKLARLAED